MCFTLLPPPRFNRGSCLGCKPRPWLALDNKVAQVA